MTYSAIYTVNHSHKLPDDEVGYCFNTTVYLVHESGHTIPINHRVWDNMGQPTKVKLTISAA